MNGDERIMFLALREFQYAKLRYLLIGLIMVLIAWLVFFVSGLAKGLSSDNASSIQTMKADYFVLQKDSDHRFNRSLLSEDQLQDVRQFVGNNASTPLGVQMTTVTKKGSSKKIDATFFAIDMNGMLAPELAEGNLINNSTKNEIIVDQSFKNEGLSIGSRIKDQLSGKEFKIVGFTKNQSFSHTPVIHMNFKEWASIQPSNAQNKLSFNALALKADQGKADNIEKNVKEVDVLAKGKALKGIPGYKEEQGSLMMMIVFLFIIAAFVLAVFFYVITIQKMNQFGVLKAIGAKSSQLARTILFQVLMLSIVSLVISMALTYGISAVLPNSMPFDLSPLLAFGCSGLFLAVSVAGSLLSLYRVVKIDAIEAIGRAV